MYNNCQNTGHWWQRNLTCSGMNSRTTSWMTRCTLPKGKYYLQSEQQSYLFQMHSALLAKGRGSIWVLRYGIQLCFGVPPKMPKLLGFWRLLHEKNSNLPFFENLATPFGEKKIWCGPPARKTAWYNFHVYVLFLGGCTTRRFGCRSSFLDSFF